MNTSLEIAKAFEQAIANSNDVGPTNEQGEALDVFVPLDEDYSIGLVRNTCREAWMLCVECELGDLSLDDREHFLDTLLETTAISRTGSGRIAGLTPEGRLALYSRISETCSAQTIEGMIEASRTLLKNSRTHPDGETASPDSAPTSWLKL
jgi:hypothetical protein